MHIKDGEINVHMVRKRDHHYGAIIYEQIMGFGGYSDYPILVARVIEAIGGVVEFYDDRDNGSYRPIPRNLQFERRAGVLCWEILAFSAKFGRCHGQYTFQSVDGDVLAHYSEAKLVRLLAINAGRLGNILAQWPKIPSINQEREISRLALALEKKLFDIFIIIAVLAGREGFSTIDVLTTEIQRINELIAKQRHTVIGTMLDLWTLKSEKPDV